MRTILGREPALVMAFVQCVIALCVAFGLELTQEQVAAVLGVTAALCALITRARVTPTPPTS